MRLLSILLLMMAAMPSQAQRDSLAIRPWESLLVDLSTAEDLSAADWEDQYEALCDMEQEPLSTMAISTFSCTCSG